MEEEKSATFKTKAQLNTNIYFGAVNQKSQKPEDLYNFIEMAFKGQRKLEIFARNHNRHFGLFSIGNELG